MYISFCCPASELLTSLNLWIGDFEKFSHFYRLLPLPHFGLFSSSWNSNHTSYGIFSLYPPYLLASSFILSICLPPWAAFWIRSSDLASFTNFFFSSTSQIHGFLLLQSFLFLEHHLGSFSNLFLFSSLSFSS